MKDKKQWQSYGKELFEIRNQLVSVIANTEYQKLLPQKERNRLQLALEHLDKFRSRAEDEMCKRNGPQCTKIWYPGR